jgi:hypothetical protein
MCTALVGCMIHWGLYWPRTVKKVVQYSLSHKKQVRPSNAGTCNVKLKWDVSQLAPVCVDATFLTQREEADELDLDGYN